MILPERGYLYKNEVSFSSSPKWGFVEDILPVPAPEPLQSYGSGKRRVEKGRIRLQNPAYIYSDFEIKNICNKYGAKALKNSDWVFLLYSYFCYLF